MLKIQSEYASRAFCKAGPLGEQASMMGCAAYMVVVQFIPFYS